MAEQQNNPSTTAPKPTEPTTTSADADKVAMEAAKRASNRINANDQQIPSSTIFTK